MILAFELTYTSSLGSHAPSNSATLQTIALAYPEQEIRVFSAENHLAELKRDRCLTSLTALSFHAVPHPRYFVDKPHIVSLRRFWAEFRAMRGALNGVQPSESCLIFLLSVTPTAIFAASLLMRLETRRHIAVQAMLHGNLHGITGWRSRNPLYRRFDLVSA